MKILWNLCEFKWYGFRVWIETKNYCHYFKLSFHLNKRFERFRKDVNMPYIVNIDPL